MLLKLMILLVFGLWVIIGLDNIYKYMPGKSLKIRELTQGLGSLWIVILAVLYLGNRSVFYNVLGLSAIALVLLLGLFIILRRRRFGSIFKWSADQNLLAKLRKMRPEEFEDFIADLYRRLGYATERVGGSRDGGVDAIGNKDGVIYYIQCKKYYTTEVGIEEIGEYYKNFTSSLAEGKRIIITTNIFTKEAMEFAKDKPIELIDGFKLLKIIKQAGKDIE